MLSVVGDVPVDSGAPVMTSSISKICRLSLSEVLIGVGLRVCIHRGECACVCECLRLYCVSKKNLIFSYLEIDEVIFIFLLINQGSRVLMEQISYV